MKGCNVKNDCSTKKSLKNGQNILTFFGGGCKIMKKVYKMDKTLQASNQNDEECAFK